MEHFDFAHEAATQRSRSIPLCGSNAAIATKRAKCCDKFRLTVLAQSLVYVKVRREAARAATNWTIRLKTPTKPPIPSLPGNRASPVVVPLGQPTNLLAGQAVTPRRPPPNACPDDS